MKMKDVRPYTIWTYPYSKHYYLTHPWRLVKEFWHNLRGAYWRSKYGFAPTDVWEFGYAFLEVVPQMLKYLAENSMGYKIMKDDGNDEENWHNHLISISNLLENARDEVRDKKNEYYPAWKKQTLDDQFESWYDEKGYRHMKAKNNEVVNNYLKRDRELAAEQDIMIEEALKLMAETPLKAIWD